MKQMNKKQQVYVEVQAFRQWWLWLIVIAAALPTAGVLFYQLYTGAFVGDKPASNTILIILTLLIPVPLFFGFYFAKLTTIIDSTGIEYGWNLPTSDLNFIPWGDIDSIEMIEYKFVGYGYRISSDYGIVYNTKGKQGKHITKKDGRKILIGTTKPKALEDYFDELNLQKGDFKGLQV